MKILSIIIAFTLLFVFTSSSFAQGTSLNNSLRKASNSAQKEAAMTKTQETRMENLRERAYKEIDRRIASLEKLIGRLSQMKRLSQDQIDGYKDEIGINIEGLTALRGKIASDTDLTTLQADVKLIVSGYRIYAFFIQYINLNAAFDRAYTVYNNINTVYAKLAARIDEAKANGEDVTILTTYLTDMNTKLTDAKSLLDSGLAELSGLSASGYPDNKANLESARTKLRTIHQDIKAAYQLARKIIQGLKAFNKNTTPQVTVQ
ncbi:MAG: hypothetical protein HY344_01800 [Candidatus Levybacteria bacterium]|nr:hypothetical protein [Candidatus Levybacteria bacterium]